MKILPNEIPDDAVPLTEVPIVPPADRLSEKLVHGKNVFVTLLTGEYYIGLCQWVGPSGFTIGTSDIISRDVVESARIV